LSDGAPIPEDGFREVQTYAYLRELGGHENVLNCYGVAEDSDWWFLVLEYCESDLHTEVTRSGAMSDERARSVTVDLLAALVYLNSHGVIHRDLSLENVLVGLDGRPRVMDFGVAFDCISQPERPLPPMEEPVGKQRYMAPEVVLRAPWDERCDLWCLGVMLYMMLTCSELPWPRADVLTNVVLQRVRRGEMRDLVREAGDKLPPMSPAAVDTFASLLTFDPEARPRLLDVLSLPWIAEELDARWAADGADEGVRPVAVAATSLASCEAARARVLSMRHQAAAAAKAAGVAPLAAPDEDDRGGAAGGGGGPPALLLRIRRPNERPPPP
jgi:serine/threonine protein kinase